jgi:hypothetical protein
MTSKKKPVSPRSHAVKPMENPPAPKDCQSRKLAIRRTTPPARVAMIPGRSESIVISLEGGGRFGPTNRCVSHGQNCAGGGHSAADPGEVKADLGAALEDKSK